MGKKGGVYESLIRSTYVLFRVPLDFLERSDEKVSFFFVKVMFLTRTFPDTSEQHPPYQYQGHQISNKCGGDAQSVFDHRHSGEDCYF